MKRVFAFIGFSTAITLVILNALPFDYSKYILIIAAAVFIPSLLIGKIRRAAVIPVCAGFAVFACLIFMFTYTNTVLPQMRLDSKFAETVFQIVEEPVKTENGYSYIVKTKSVKMENAPQNFKMRLKSKHKINADYYDCVTGKVNFYSIGDNGFDSYGYFGDGVFLTCTLREYSVEKTKSKPVNYYFIKLRISIENSVKEHLGNDNAGLIVALLTGKKDMLSDKVIGDFKSCGISHLIVVSGLHLSIVCSGFYFLLKKLGVRVLPRTVAAFLALFLYLGVAGFSKSVLRAGIMLGVLLLSKLVSAKADYLNSLGFAVFLLCLNPFAVTDPGAVLSVSAMLGLLTVNPVLNRFFTADNKLVSYVLKSVLATISVTLTTLPAMWLYFKNASVLGILLNIVMIPPAQIALISGMILSVFSGSYILAFVPKYVCICLTQFMIKTADFFARYFSFAYIDMSDNYFALAISATLLFLTVSLFVNKRIRLKSTFVFISAAFIITSLFAVFTINNTAYVKIFSSGAVAAYDNDAVILIDISDNSDLYSCKDVIGKNNTPVLFINNDVLDEKELAGSIKIIESVRTDSDFSIDLCSDFNVKCNSGIIVLTVNDIDVTITEEKVFIGNRVYSRNAYTAFSDSSDIVIAFRDNSVITVGRGR